jgi:hypothetical protein
VLETQETRTRVNIDIRLCVTRRTHRLFYQVQVNDIQDTFDHWQTHQQQTQAIY